MLFDSSSAHFYYDISKNILSNYMEMSMNILIPGFALYYNSDLLQTSYGNVLLKTSYGNVLVHDDIITMLDDANVSYTFDMYSNNDNVTYTYDISFNLTTTIRFVELITFLYKGSFTDEIDNINDILQIGENSYSNADGILYLDSRDGLSSNILTDAANDEYFRIFESFLEIIPRNIYTSNYTFFSADEIKIYEFLFYKEVGNDCKFIIIRTDNEYIWENVKDASNGTILLYNENDIYKMNISNSIDNVPEYIKGINNHISFPYKYLNDDLLFVKYLYNIVLPVEDISYNNEDVDVSGLSSKYIKKVTYYEYSLLIKRDTKYLSGYISGVNYKYSDVYELNKTYENRFEEKRKKKQSTIWNNQQKKRGESTLLIFDYSGSSIKYFLSEISSNEIIDDCVTNHV